MMGCEDIIRSGAIRRAEFWREAMGCSQPRSTGKESYFEEKITGDKTLRCVSLLGHCMRLGLFSNRR